MPAGAPSLLTPDMIRATVDALPRCLYLETVADLLGIDRGTLRIWVRTGAREARRRLKGRDPDRTKELNVRLHTEVMRAFAQTTSNLLDRISRASLEHWQAAAWILERRCPDLWGRDRHEVMEMKRAIKDLEARIAEMSPTGTR